MKLAMLSFHSPPAKALYSRALELSSRQFFYKLLCLPQNQHKFRKPSSGSQPWSPGLFWTLNLSNHCALLKICCSLWKCLIRCAFHSFLNLIQTISFMKDLSSLHGIFISILQRILKSVLCSKRGKLIWETKEKLQLFTNCFLYHKKREQNRADQ